MGFNGAWVGFESQWGCLIFCYGFLSFGFEWVGFWILIWFRVDLDWLVGLAWWVVGCLVVFTMGLLGIWWVLFFVCFFFFFGVFDSDGQWWHGRHGGNDWIVWFF